MHLGITKAVTTLFEKSCFLSDTSIKSGAFGLDTCMAFLHMECKAKDLDMQISDPFENCLYSLQH